MKMAKTVTITNAVAKIVSVSLHIWYRDWNCTKRQRRIKFEQLDVHAMLQFDFRNMNDSTASNSASYGGHNVCRPLHVIERFSKGKNRGESTSHFYSLSISMITEMESTKINYCLCLQCGDKKIADDDTDSLCQLLFDEVTTTRPIDGAHKQKFDVTATAKRLSCAQCEQKKLHCCQSRIVG